MAETNKKPSQTSRIRETLAKHKEDKKVATVATPAKTAAPKVATVASSNTVLQAPKKPTNKRSAKARDLRMKVRGRLPVNAQFFSVWNGVKHEGRLTVYTVPPGIDNYKGGDIVNDMEMDEATVPVSVKKFFHKAEGVFRLMEELDVMFWEWYAKVATAEEKAKLVFAPDPGRPEPYPKEEA